MQEGARAPGAPLPVAPLGIYEVDGVGSGGTFPVKLTDAKNMQTQFFASIYLYVFLTIFLTVSI